ncbi:Gamma-tubulin complex component 3, partial [Zea mays]
RGASIEGVIKPGVVPRFVQFLTREDLSQLQFRSHADRWFERIYKLQLRGKGKPKSKSKDTGSWFDGGRKAMIQLAGELFWKMGEDLDSIAKIIQLLLMLLLRSCPCNNTSI